MASFTGLVAALALTTASPPDRGLEPINPKNPNVIPIAWASFPATVPTDADSLRVRSVLQNANRYAVTTWYNTAKNYDSQAGTYLDFGGTGEGNIRAPASEALSLALSLKLGAYDPAVTGVSSAAAKDITLKLIRSLAYRHRINTANGWGNDWQTALWAYYAGMAGWLMWSDLSATDQEYVRKMVVYEADRFIGYQTPYYRSPTGTILTPGDSKAEENSWNAQILQLATSMMPSHWNYRAWMSKNVELMLSSFARPADLSNATAFNGAAFSWWLDGSNANNDFMVINHDRVHPDYTATISQNLNAPLIAAMAGAAAPQAAMANATGIFDAMVDLTFVPGTLYPETGVAIASPGGTIFQAGSSDLYFPQGNDWGTRRRAHIASLDVMVRAFGLDASASVPASTWEDLHMQRVLDDQNRSIDGRAYQSSVEDVYSGREEWVAALVARAWWAKWVAVKNLWAFSNQSIAIVIDNKDRDFSVVSGTWAAASTGTQNLGTGYRSSAAGTGTSKVRYSFNIPTSGSYKIYAWWGAAPTNATNARFTVNHAGGPTTVLKNQTIDGGQFNLIGTYTFNAGGGQYLEIDNAANGTVVADGVLFMRTDTL